MGRHDSLLVPFLEEGLKGEKYKKSLFFKGDSKSIFCIIFPHKTKGIPKEDEQIFKDWYELKSKEYNFGTKDYTKAKQAMKISLKNSSYVEKVSNSPKDLTYKILNQDEIKKKKLLKKKRKEEIKKQDPYNSDSIKSVDAGYVSGDPDSPHSHSGFTGLGSTDESLEIFWQFLQEQNVSIEELNRLVEELSQIPT